MATTTRTATVTLPSEQDTPDPIDSALRIVTETITATQAIETSFTLTERVTITVVPAVVPIEVTRTTTSTSTSTATVNNGKGRNDAAQAQETGIPFDYTCRPGDANEKYPGGMSLSATDNQRTTLCELSCLHS